MVEYLELKGKSISTSSYLTEVAEKVELIVYVVTSCLIQPHLALQTLKTVPHPWHGHIQIDLHRLTLADLLKGHRTGDLYVLEVRHNVVRVAIFVHNPWLVVVECGDIGTHDVHC